MRISLIHHTETLSYARDELCRYLRKIDPTVMVELSNTPSREGITLALLADLGLSTDDVSDPLIDDVIDIDVQNMHGYIAGSNERSVLMGVYTFLKSAGCRWVRPGNDGEYIPKKGMHNYSFRYRKKADLPFRGECIEGAVSFEHVRDTILWLPKVNMNLFMMEQIVPYNYMSRWYKHEKNTVKKDENVPFEAIGEMVLRLDALIKKCGLQHHALGHGYQMEPYGIHYKTRSDTYVLSDEAKQDVALVKGVRQLYKNSPNFTQMCYSRPEVRKKQVDFLVSYLEHKPYIDFLHVWLADSVNNHCECEGCKQMIPSDFYVILLNELDAALTAKGIDTRIVFIAYTDTNWAPEKERLTNPGRFVLTTANTGHYPAPRSEVNTRVPLPPFERNNYNIKGSVPLSLSFLDAWRNSCFKGPAFMFDYYFYTGHFLDPGYMDLTRAIYRDVLLLENYGFSGIMSDQTQRSFFPTGLPLSLLGELQFDRSLDLQSYIQAFFADAFGEDAEQAHRYLESISTAFDPDSFRLRDSIVLQDTGVGEKAERTNGIKNNPQAASRLETIPAIAAEFLPTVQKNLSSQNPCHARSWRLLEIHTEYVTKLAAILALYAKGEAEMAMEKFEDMIDWLSHLENEIHPQFDLVLFHQRYSQFLKS